MHLQNIKEALQKVSIGFEKILVDDNYKKNALNNIEQWLSKEQFREYQEQILYLIEQEKFDVLLNSFYQNLPFGTGGRRGKVGIGPNRLNPWTVQALAQGHCNYMQKHKENNKELAVVLAYDIRKFPLDNTIFSPKYKNPIKGITSKEFAIYAAQVYKANGISCYIFSDVRSTPELSFAVRYLNTQSGAMFTASHNPKEYNGQKVYTSDGGLLLAPLDQYLEDEVTQVSEIKSISRDEIIKQNKMTVELEKQIDEHYIQNIINLLLLPAKQESKNNLKIVFSPLHGVGHTSVLPALKKANFNVTLDQRTSTPDGGFPNVKFNIPNPEYPSAMETLIEKGKEINAEILLACDPDADRMGMMSKISGEYASSEYKFYTGNEIAIIITNYLLEELSQQQRLPKKAVIVKTTVTSELIEKICKAYNADCKGNFPVGFKYISHVIKELEDNGEEKRFLFGAEESHGVLVGSYTRDKDASGAILILCELTQKLADEGKNLKNYLKNIYKKYGYHNNTQSSLILTGAEGKKKINLITDHLRKNPPSKIGDFDVISYQDFWQGSPILSKTDKNSRNIQILHLKHASNVADIIKVTIRPSGTEPKLKLYVEVGGKSIGENALDEKLNEQQTAIKSLNKTVLKEFNKLIYSILGIDMPDRGFKLSSHLPLEIKIKYFEIEQKILDLETNNSSKEETQNKLDELLSIFGKDPIEKITNAFQEKTGMHLRDYIEKKLGIPNYTIRI